MLPPDDVLRTHVERIVLAEHCMRYFPRGSVEWHIARAMKRDAHKALGMPKRRAGTET